MLYNWVFRCNDNGGKKQSFTIKANSKPDAIEKGFRKASKAAKGDIIAWECELKKG